MSQPHIFIKWNGVLNSACLVVLAVFAVMGFYGYLAVGNKVADTVTLNLPRKPYVFYPSADIFVENLFIFLAVAPHYSLHPVSVVYGGRCAQSSVVQYNSTA